MPGAGALVGPPGGDGSGAVTRAAGDLRRPRGTAWAMSFTGRTLPPPTDAVGVPRSSVDFAILRNPVGVPG